MTDEIVTACPGSTVKDKDQGFAEKKFSLDKKRLVKQCSFPSATRSTRFPLSFVFK